MMENTSKFVLKIKQFYLSNVVIKAVIILFLQTLHSNTGFVSEGREIWFKAFVNGQEIQLFHHRNGEVAQIDLVETEGQNVNVTCSSTYPVIWDIWFHSQVVNEDKVPRTRMDRIVQMQSNGTFIYQTTLTLEGHFGGRFQCRRVDTKTLFKSITLYVKILGHGDSILINSGRKFTATPVLGQTEILLPCHVASQNSDVYVEKLGIWGMKSRAVDIPFDPVLNGFVITSTGELKDLSRYMGTYRCLQYGFDDFVEVEVSSPLEHVANPPETEIVAGMDSPIQVSCSSRTHVDLIVGTKNQGHSVATRIFRPNDTFAHSQNLVYHPSSEEFGEIWCETKTSEIIHKWKYHSIKAKVVLEISEDRRTLKCFGTNSSATPLLMAIYLKTYDEVLHNVTTGASDKDEDEMSAFTVSNCNESNCNFLTPLKTGGILVICRSEGVEQKAAFFIDIDMKLFPSDEKIPLENIARIQHITEESDLYQIKCRWSPFFLAQNAFWTIGQDRVDNKTFAITLNSDGSLETSLSINLNTFENGRVNISCHPALWHAKNVLWNPDLLRILVNKLPHKLQNDRPNEESVTTSFAENDIVKDAMSATIPITLDCTNNFRMLMTLLLSLVMVIAIQCAIIYKLINTTGNIECIANHNAIRCNRSSAAHISPKKEKRFYRSATVN